MTPPDTIDDDFLRQAGQHLAGDLDVAGRAALAARLRADPQARQQYRDLLTMDVLLRDHVGEELSPTARIALRKVPRRTARGRRRGSAPRRLPLAMWVGLTAAAAVLTLVVVQTAPRRPLPDTGAVFAATLSGDAAIWRAGVLVAAPLRPGDTIVVSTAAELLFPDRSRVVLAPGSRLRLDGDQQQVTGVRVQLETGTARCELQPQRRGFRLATSRATVAVLGTSFTATAAAQATTIVVASGRVRIDAGGDSAELVSGDQAEVTAGGLTVTRAVAPATSAVADFTRADLWVVRGPLPVEIGPGHLVVPPEPVPPDLAHVWSGRSWQWHRPLAATDSAAIAGVLRIPAGQGARDWQAELFCADADTVFDGAEGQPATCIRLVLRDRRASVQRLVSGPDSGQAPWQADALAPEDGTVALGLELVAGELIARVDGRIVWQGAMPYERALLGIRLARRRSDAALAPVEWQTVTLTAP